MTLQLQPCSLCVVGDWCMYEQLIKEDGTMKTYFYTALGIASLLPALSHANTFCVSDATGLQTALTTAAGNGEDDTVQIQQGTYVGNFLYTSTEAFSLTVEGGYTSSCSSRVVDPANTVLDANNSGVVLVITAPNVWADFVVDGLTIQNGNTSSAGGGLYVNGLRGIFTLKNNSIISNSSTIGGGVYISDSGSVTFTNNIIDSNTSLNRGGGVVISHYYPVDIQTVLSNNVISNNNADDIGGGIYMAAGEMILNDNTVLSQR